MSTEEIGLTIGFVSLFITMMGIAITAGRGYGSLQEQSKRTNGQLDKLIDDNTKSHGKIYDSLQELNGTVREHGIEIKNLKGN